MLEESSNKFEAFRSADLPKYAPTLDHPFKMFVQRDGTLGISPGIVRPSLAYGMPAFVPTYYGQQLKSLSAGQLTTAPRQDGRYYIQTTGFWITLAAIEPRNLRVFVPTAGDIRHESDVPFGDPNVKLVQLGTVLADRVVNQLVRSDLTMADIVDVPYTGVPGVGPFDPGLWPQWPDGSGGQIPYGYNGDGEATTYGDALFD